MSSKTCTKWIVASLCRKCCVVCRRLCYIPPTARPAKACCMPVLRRTRTLMAAAGVFGAMLLATFLFVAHMRRTLQGAGETVAKRHELRFSLGPYRPAVGAGFTPLVAPANLRAGVALHGTVYLSGPGELIAFDGSGAQQHVWHVGADLPGAALGPVVAVQLRGVGRPQIAVGTAGAGVLLWDDLSGQMRQLLPAAAELRDVTALAALPDGELVLGTRRAGVLSFDGEKLQVFRPEFKGLNVTSLLATADDLWVGTQSDGVYALRGGTTQHFTAELPDLHVESLAAEGERVFAGTPDGVAQFEAGQSVRRLAPGVFAHGLNADAHTLWIAGLEGGTTAVALDAKRARPMEIAAFATEARTNSFLGLPGNEGPYAIREDGLYQPKASGWTRVAGPEAAALADGNVSALAFAPDGALWVGYFDHGIDVLNLQTAKTTHVENDHLFCVNRIVRDPRRNTMAVATANGLVLFDRAGVPRQVLGRRDGLINEHVTDVAFDRDTMAVATPAGLSFVGPNGVDSLYAFQGLVNNHVYALAVAQDSDGLIAGTLGGLSLLEHGAVRRNLTATNSTLRHNWITAVLPLPSFAGRGFLLGTYGGGLMRMFPDGELAAMQNAPKDTVINPNALLATDTHLYAGSMGGGLWVYGRGSQQWQQVTAGLPSLNVTALVARDGELYVGTENGLVHVAEARLPQ